MKPKENQRYFVPDLSPMDRRELAGLKPRAIFVAESPHVSEVEPDERLARRPLCGAAGKVWWKLLSEIFEGTENPDVSLARLLEICRKNRIVVLNAVQNPLDPKVAKKFPAAEPVECLGFAKAAGPSGYKKMKNDPCVLDAVEKLRKRLTHPALARAPIWSLGNDAEWFVTRALTPEEQIQRVRGKLPHPSAWWRRGGLFGRTAKEKLTEIFLKDSVRCR